MVNNSAITSIEYMRFLKSELFIYITNVSRLIKL